MHQCDVSVNLIFFLLVPVSKPVLSIVGGTLLLGKPFQLLCQSERGTLPISYTLYGPEKLNESRDVRKPGDKAIFNCPAIFKSSDLSKFLCHARNHKNKVPMIGSGQLMLKSTNIIGENTRTISSLLSGKWSKTC